jgi:hypothetical protein
MRGYIRQEPTDEVEKARVRHAEACELRLARIQNGAEPGFKNGPWEVTLSKIEKDGKSAWQFSSASGRKSPVFRTQRLAEDWRAEHPKWD